MNALWQSAGLAPPPAARPATARCFLFLQGLPGPFFARLAERLQLAGARVLRINFCGGDEADWPHPGAIAFRGRAGAFPGFLAERLAAHGVTDVVLFGDSRPLHVEARALCAARGLPVHVFEEGYLRPDFVTLERGGVNGHSPLPRSLPAVLAEARRLPPVPDFAAIPGDFRRRARESARYYLHSVVARPRYPNFIGHRPVGPVTEGLGWLRRFAGAGAEERRTRLTLAGLDAPYFLLPLQLDSDSQLRVHSPYGAMRPALAEVIASFARAAPPPLLLLVKQHPLDPGLIDWRRQTAALAAAAGVAARVRFVERGEIGAITAAAEGLVTINSTTGTLALAAGVPVKVLGSAVYDLRGITFGGDLDSFWAAPGRVDTEAYQALRRVLVHRSLLYGGFHSEAGLAALVTGAAARLLAS